MRWNSFLKKILTYCFCCCLVGCGDIRDIAYKESLLSTMAKTNAPESVVRDKLPLKWTILEKGASKGDAFGDSLMTKQSPDLAQTKVNWEKCDRALWHTTESVVTVVFLKSNQVVGYYVGIQ